MKKILIGTHNQGKFKEFSYLISKRYKKISPTSLKIPSPKETGKTFYSNSVLKVNFFSNYVSYPVISDDSGLCIKSLNNKPGIFSARLAKKYGSFYKAMKFILKKMKNKKNRSAYFICSLSFKQKNQRVINVVGKVHGTITYKILGKIYLVNLFFISSLFILIIYLTLSTLITPLALNKSRSILNNDQLNSLLPAIKSQSFTDAFKGMTFIVNEKKQNEVRDVFIHDKGENLKNLSNLTSDNPPKNVILLIDADRGYIKGKYPNKGVYFEANSFVLHKSQNISKKVKNIIKK